MNSKRNVVDKMKWLRYISRLLVCFVLLKIWIYFFEFIIHLIAILELFRFYFWILSNTMFDSKIESKISFLLLLAIINYLLLLEFVVSYDSLNLWITLAEGFFLSIFWFFCGQSALIEAIVNFDPEMTPKGSFRFLLRFVSQFFYKDCCRNRMSARKSCPKYW